MYNKIFSTKDFRINFITNSKEFLRLIDNYLDFPEGNYPAPKITATFEIIVKKPESRKNKGDHIYQGYLLNEAKISPFSNCLVSGMQINAKRCHVQASIVNYRESMKEHLLDFVFLKPLRIILAHQGLFPLHSSSVERGNACVLISGEGNSGKSTLAYTLARNGFELLADDDCFVKLSGKRTLLFPFPTKMGVMDGRKTELEKYILKNYRFGIKRRVCLRHIYSPGSRNYYRNKLLLFPKYCKNKGIQFRNITGKEALGRLAKENIDLFFRQGNQKLAIKNFWALYVLTKEARCFELCYNDSLLNKIPDKIRNLL